MKPTYLTVLLATVTALVWSSLPSMAQTGTTTFTTATSGSYTGDVINSTYTFTGVGVSGPGSVTLQGTTIPNLGSLNPPVTLQLILSSITYTEQSVTGDGAIPSVTFDLTPGLGSWVPGGSLPSTQVTLYASGPIANGVTDNNVVFSLANPPSNPDPVVWQPVVETTPGNGNEDNGGTWQVSLSNLEPDPDSITFSGGSNFVPNSVQNQNFTFGGSLEVIYATPEPGAFSLGAVGFAIFAVLYRRHRLKS